MKKSALVSGLSAVVSGIALIILRVVTVFIAAHPAEDSIGIIGGADAPTAIFLASSFWRNIFGFLGVSGIAGIVCILMGIAMLTAHALGNKDEK